MKDGQIAVDQETLREKCSFARKATAEYEARKDGTEK